jgi:hypothetical protein
MNTDWIVRGKSSNYHKIMASRSQVTLKFKNKSGSIVEQFISAKHTLL